MTSLRHFIATVCVAFISACSTVMAPAHSGFLTRYDALMPSPDGGSASARSAVAIDPARVSIGEVAWRATAEVSDDERQSLLDLLRDELAVRVREMPAAPQGRTAVLRAAITRVEPVSPALNAASALLLIVPLDSGGAAVDLEALDPNTGEQLAALTLGHATPLSDLKARFSRLAPARAALRKAASDFGALLNTRTAPGRAGGLSVRAER